MKGTLIILLTMAVAVAGATDKKSSLSSSLSSPVPPTPLPPATVTSGSSTNSAADAIVSSSSSSRQQKSYPNSNDARNKRIFFPGTPPPGSNLFNTSIAFTIPLFTVNTKSLTKARSFFDGFDSGVYGGGGGGGGVGFPLGSGVVAGIAVPALIAGILILLFDIFSRPFLTGTGIGGRATDSIFSGGLGGITEYLLTFVENSLDHVPTIDGEECIKRSVCEAHSNPKKYGIIALPLQLLFPPYPYTGTDDTSKMSKYQLAARYGKNDNANCAAQYNGCVINPLDLISSFARMITDF